MSRLHVRIAVLISQAVVCAHAFGQANDSFANRMPWNPSTNPSAPSAKSFVLRPATFEPGEPACGAGDEANTRNYSLWWRYTPSAPGYLLTYVRGEQYAGWAINVFKGATLTQLTRVNSEFITPSVGEVYVYTKLDAGVEYAIRYCMGHHVSIDPSTSPVLNNPTTVHSAFDTNGSADLSPEIGPKDFTLGSGFWVTAKHTGPVPAGTFNAVVDVDSERAITSLIAADQGGSPVRNCTSEKYSANGKKWRITCNGVYTMMNDTRGIFSARITPATYAPGYVKVKATISGAETPDPNLTNNTLVVEAYPDRSPENHDAPAVPLIGLVVAGGLMASAVWRRQRSKLS